jgi:hypothetical protein
MQAPIPAGTLRKSGLFVREEKYFHGGTRRIAGAYNYHLRPSSLAGFIGTHPDVMSARIARINWNFRRIRSTKPAFFAKPKYAVVFLSEFGKVIVCASASLLLLS